MNKLYLKGRKSRYIIQYKFRFYLTLILFSLMILFGVFIYSFDKFIAPTVLMLADAELKAKTVEIINNNINDVYVNGFSYDEIMSIDRDQDGKINLVKADSIKLNSLATSLAAKCQKDMKELGEVGVEVPMGYITKSNILSYIGPKVKVKMEPVGRIETSYESTFESAGINQTRHIIYINMNAKLKLVLPLNSKDIEVKHQIPVSDITIVGEIPRVNIGNDPVKDSVSNIEK